jgi:hypothetical protein
MKLAASTESLRTWQRRSEHTGPVSQRERLPRHDLTDCLLQAYDDLIFRAYAIFLDRNGKRGEDWLSAERNFCPELQPECRNPSEFVRRWEAFRDPPWRGNLHRARSRATLFWQQFQMIPNYRTAIARNMKGVILAHGLYLAAGLLNLAVRSCAYGFSASSNIIEPFSYLVSLSIWLTAMWSYHPNPVPALVIRPEADHEDWVSRTRTVLGAVRSHFAKAAHP